MFFQTNANGTQSDQSENCNKKVNDAWSRTKQILFQEGFVPWKFFPKGTTFEPSAGSGFPISEIIVTQSTADATSIWAYEDMAGAEAYNLTIPGHGNSYSRKPGAVYIDATSSLGVLHAFNTLTQLFYASASSKSKIYSPLAPVEIQDQPLFIHRGLNFDVARQWYDKNTILKTIDALSWNKFNRLHLHITDSQSWPLEIPSMPDLAKKGAYHPGLTYSPQDVQDIQDYAEARGIQVIIEIDMPGHTTAIAEAYPDLIVGKNIQPNWDTYAAQPPSGSMKLNNPDVENFVTKLFADLLPRLRGHTPYFHTGGDEVNSNIYNLDPGVQSNESSVLQPLIEKFVNHAHDEVKNNQMSPIVWEEILLDWNVTNMPKETVVQTWRSELNTKKVVEAGFRAIGGNVRASPTCTKPSC